MISVLAKRFFAESPALGFAVIALVLFIAAFVAIAIRVARTDKRQFQDLARLPLQQDTRGGKHDG